ncbi:MAG: FtsQ-type POTRA domain-containing protein [Oscillospiraceae bacterium]|nr:FtsQ-type POTRA domain-containing protein [Oscillospiraceae bacterium]
MKIRIILSKIKKVVLTALVLAFVMALFLFLANSYFFKIKNIQISENDKYSYDDILQASGISIGEDLYGVNLNETENKIKKKLTYAKSVNITQIPPSTLNIEIEIERGFFAIMIGGDYYVISKTFDVMDKIKVPANGEAGLPGEIITVEANEIKKCYLGEKIEFSDGDIYDFLKGIVELFEKNESGALSEIKNIDISDKFKVAMNYGDRFLVKFGIFENIAPKIMNAFEIMNELAADDKGIIDMTDGKAVSFKYVENISDLLEFGKNKTFD